MATWTHHMLATMCVHVIPTCTLPKALILFLIINAQYLHLSNFIKVVSILICTEVKILQTERNIDDQSIGYRSKTMSSASIQGIMNVPKTDDNSC